MSVTRQRFGLTVCARLSLTVGLLLTSAGCESLIGLEDRHLVDAGNEGGVVVPTDVPSDKECEQYCELMKGSDGGVGACNKVYTSPAACTAVCKTLKRGDLREDQRDPSVFNTYACRLHYAKLAQTDPTKCLAAGPGGQGGCGSNCESYCAMFAASGCSAVIAQPSDLAICKNKCELGLRDNMQLDSADGHDHEGNTVQCRLVHISNALAYKISMPLADPIHCRHAAISASELCVDDLTKPISDLYCTSYCNLVKTACTNTQRLYESDAQCMSVCKAIEPGTHGMSGANTMGCRYYHAYNSLLMNDSHCGHAGAGGFDTGHCGDECASYCHLAAGACGAAFAQKYPGAEPEKTCYTQCAAVPKAEPMKYDGYTVAAGMTAANMGDSLQCRLYYTVKAIETPADSAASCLSALGSGSCSPR